MRIQAVLKRARQSAVSPVDTVFCCGPIRIDLAKRGVTLNDEFVHLTRTEYNLLHELALHRNQVLLHEALLTVVWGPEYRDDVDYLRAYIRYLRQKLEADPSNPVYIVTSQGVGYMLVCPDEDDA